MKKPAKEIVVVDDNENEEEGEKDRAKFSYQPGVSHAFSSNQLGES